MTTDQEIFAAAPESINHDTLLDLVTRYQPKEVAKRANAGRKKPVLSDTNVRERLNRALTRFAKEHSLDRADVKAVHDAIRASGGEPIEGENGADSQMPSGVKKVTFSFKGSVVRTMNGVQQSISERIKTGVRRRVANRAATLPAAAVMESEAVDAGVLLDAIEGPEELTEAEAEAFRNFDASEEMDIDVPESRVSHELKRGDLDHKPSSELSDAPESMDWSGTGQPASGDHDEEADDEEEENEEEEEADVDEELSVLGDRATPVVPRVDKGKGRAMSCYPPAWFEHSDPAEDTDIDPEVEAIQISNFWDTLKRGRKARSLLPERCTDATSTRIEEEFIPPTFPPVWSLPFTSAAVKAGATSTSIPADDEDSGLSSAESDADEAAIEEKFLEFEVHKLFEEETAYQYGPVAIWDDDIIKLYTQYTIREIVNHLNKDMPRGRLSEKHTAQSVSQRIDVVVERMALRLGREHELAAYRAKLLQLREENGVLDREKQRLRGDRQRRR
ncbi:hypothetical protein LTR56_007377 [Elasticomyces elasticus]|nr:hypothetical protein LTR56_007377 [Elasticomyces elasticus]KAK3668082.1 hypothetical protein LTR22_001150 [Elasticomyces elasticus]KAK4925231.1 hypothetical protein LTR49_007769 [Elasticomyces elasticus]KAK5767722.1 hypothetical protein LTS12_002224 [Elasticomyces elasticus]